MSAPLPLCPLGRALLVRLPGAQLVGRSQAGWHSATFSGERVVLKLELAGEDSAVRADAFAAALPDAEFHLPRQIVADILVSERRETGDAMRLTVEALLLDVEA